MTPVREAITLPAIFFTVILAGSVQWGEATRFVPAPLFAIVLAFMLVGALGQSGTLVPSLLMRSDRRPLENLNGLVVALTLFAASAQVLAALIPANGLPAVLMTVLLFALLAQALALRPSREQFLRGLAVSFGVAFTLKFVVLAALSAPAAGRLTRIVQLLFEGVTFGTVTQPPLAPAAGYVTLGVLLLYLWGLVLLPRPQVRDGEIVVTPSRSEFPK